MVSLVKSTKRYAWKPVVCRGCGFIIHRESYTAIDDKFLGIQKSYHLYCKVQETEVKGE